MTPNEITTEIAMQLSKELDDVFKLMLFQKVGNWRSRLIRNSLEKKPAEAKFFQQTLYVPMTRGKVPPECITIPGYCPAAKSTSQLPVPLRYGASLFEFVGSADGSKAFSFGTPEVASYLSSGKYSKRNVYYDWIDSYIVVEGHPNLPMIQVRGVFDAPEKVMEFNCESGIDCDYWDKEYPITREMLQQVITYIVQEFRDPALNTGKQIEVNPQPAIANEPDGR